MPAGAQHVNTALIHINWYLPERLDRIRMEEDAVLAGNPADFTDGLDGPDLVIGIHHRNQDG